MFVRPALSSAAFAVVIVLPIDVSSVVLFLSEHFCVTLVKFPALPGLVHVSHGSAKGQCERPHLPEENESTQYAR